MLGSFQLDGWWVDPATGEMTRGPERVQLEPRVMGVLAYLAEQRDRFVSKDELLQAVWRGTAVTDYALWRCVSQLRKVFRDEARTSTIIETLPKRGYRLRAPVSFHSRDGAIEMLRRAVSCQAAGDWRGAARHYRRARSLIDRLEARARQSAGGAPPLDEHG